MKNYIYLLFLVVFASVSCSKNDINAPESNIKILENGEKEVTIHVGAERLGNADAARKITSLSVTDAGNIDIKWMTWQWEMSDVIIIEATNPKNGEKVKRTFTAKEVGQTIVTEGGKVQKDKSYDGWGIFTGTMPEWWNASMSVMVYAGPETYSNTFARRADALKDVMRFETATPCLLTEKITLLPKWAVIMVQAGTSLNSTTYGDTHYVDNDPLKGTLTSKVNWHFNISQIELLDLKTDDSPTLLSLDYPFDDTNIGNIGHVENVVFIVEPQTFEHFTLRYVIDDSEWYLTNPTNVPWGEKDEVSNVLKKQSAMTVKAGDFIYYRNAVCTLCLKAKEGYK